MGRFPKALFGAAMATGIGVSPIERAEAQSLPTELPNSAFPFDELAKNENPEDVAELLDHLDRWAYRENATEIAMRLAKKYPKLFVLHSSALLYSGIPWGHDALRIAFQSDWKDYETEFVSTLINTNDPYIIHLLEESVTPRYKEILDLFWTHYSERDLSAHEKNLLHETICSLPSHHPQYFLKEIYSDEARFRLAVPDAKIRNELLESAVTNAISSENHEDLKTVVQFAEWSEDVRKAIARSYGWDRFLNRCSTQIPGTVLNAIGNTRESRLFLSLASGKPRMDLYRHAAKREPLELILQWQLHSNQQFHFTPSEEKEFVQLVGEAFDRLITEDFEHFYQGLLTPETLAQFPQIRQALFRVAKNNPVGLLDALEANSYYTIPVDVTEFRHIAARNAIEKRAWVNASPRERYTNNENTRENRINEKTRTTVEYFVGLPDEAALTELWFLGAVVDAPATALRPLFAQSDRPRWFNEVLRTDIMYLLDESPENISEFFSEPKRSSQNTGRDPREHISFDDLNLILGARAKDDFEAAVDDAKAVLRQHGEQNPKLAYELLWILEQSQPYEFAAFIKKETLDATTDGLSTWKSLVSAQEWDALLAHANHIEAESGYADIDPPKVIPGFRFTRTVLDALLGMNYRHKLQTAFPASDYERASSGENFITIPMLAFETIVTSPAFEDYIDAHAEENLSFITLCSTAQATWRRLRDLQLSPSSEHIRRALADVEYQWEQVKHVEVFGPHTNVITIAHEETRFSNTALIHQLILGHGGNERQVRFEGKGPKDKQAVLFEIGKQQTNPVTIVFNGHGFEQGLSLGKSAAISPSELGDALISSGNIQNTRLVIHACRAYNFVEELLKYLRRKAIDASGLVIITGANKDAFGFGLDDQDAGLDSPYLQAVHTQNIGVPITVNAFRKAEDVDWIYQDPSITVGLPLSEGWITGIEVADAELDEK